MSDAGPIPDDVRRFIMTSVPSVPFLEAMLLFQKQPHMRRNVAEVAARLYIKEAAAHTLLQDLAAAGVLALADAESGRFRYAPRDTGLAALIDHLAGVYSTHLIDISNLIHDQTQRNALQFANAFKLRKD